MLRHSRGQLVEIENDTGKRLHGDFRRSLKLKTNASSLLVLLLLVVLYVVCDVPRNESAPSHDIAKGRSFSLHFYISQPSAQSVARPHQATPSLASTTPVPSHTTRVRQTWLRSPACVDATPASAQPHRPQTSVTRPLTSTHKQRAPTAPLRALGAPVAQPSHPRVGVSVAMPHRPGTTARHPHPRAHTAARSSRYIDSALPRASPPSRTRVGDSTRGVRHSRVASATRMSSTSRCALRVAASRARGCQVRVPVAAGTGVGRRRPETSAGNGGADRLRRGGAAPEFGARGMPHCEGTTLAVGGRVP
ncbi:hypothetical protein PLICRDRAFT_174835 [Plicaturopsis crispa FD-325 SS-3]|nr:hypothetical protein PLICRDRAFT_174835 [Plicaturopsis crispa FD-325 SS-3]